MLTVGELLRGLDVRVRCGESGLRAPVRWVHITELEDPTPWLSGGEVVLTTGLALETPRKQRAFLERLADHGIAALGFGTGFSHRGVPKALRDVAAARDLPLFEVPYEVPFIAITEKAFTRLVNEQYAVLQRAIAAHERLERIVLSEQGLAAVLAALSQLVGGAALVFDARGQLLEQHAFREPLEARAVEALSDDLRARQRDSDPGGPGGRHAFAPSRAGIAGRALALPIAATGAPHGRGEVPLAWLAAVKDDGPLTEFDRLCLHQAVTIVALELLRRRVADDTERRLAGDVLAEIVSGELAGADAARRLEPFGLGERVTALVLAPAPGTADACETALHQALRDQVVGGLVASSGPLVCALLPDAGRQEDAFALAERVRAQAAAELGDDLEAGAGRSVGAGQVRRSYHEARCALEARALGAGARANGNGHGRHGAAGDAAPASLATYRDLGSFQLLLSLQDDDALRLFCDSILGPIEGGEGHYGGELMRSLEAFIECNGQWEAAARRLYCHRHTLRYRMRKIEELTGRDLSSARDRIEFWLALRGRELAPAPERAAR